jgi:CheY-like chemotaxis protein
VLVAEDNASIRRILCHILQQAGFEPREAKDGREALELLAGGGFDLAVLDILMPRLDGISACRAVKSDPKLKSIPVVLCTSRDRRTDALRALHAGADDTILKPFDREQIVARLRRVLGPGRGEPAAERRGAVRVALEGSATWFSRRATDERRIFRNRIFNICPTGIGLREGAGQDGTAAGRPPLEPLPRPDEEVEVVVQIRDALRFEARGKVVHVTPQPDPEAGTLVGISFTSLSPEAREAIAGLAP